MNQIMVSADMFAAPARVAVRRFLLFYLGVAVGLAALLVAGLRLRGAFWLELNRSGVAAVALAAALCVLGALLGTWILARARVRETGVGRAARRSQVWAVAPLALGAVALAWYGRAQPGMVLAPQSVGYAIGAAGVALAFPLLIVERLLAATEARLLPEAAALRALAFVAVLASFIMGLCEIAAAFGPPFTDRVAFVPSLAVGLVALELAARALGNLFLPPPAADQARAAATSVLAQMLCAGVRARGLAAPMRTHFGIDFSRSWALAYVGRSFWPMVVGLAGLGWVLSGVAVVPLESRAIYERFGAPVRVLQPGLHMMLPWPLGIARRQDFGAVHALALSQDNAAAGPMVGAEDLAPLSADRLWDSPHPGEITLTIASGGVSQQNFQSVSADIKLLYRVGLSDGQAMAATYGAADPQALVRSVSGRVIAAYYASRTLDMVLGANREAMAADLRAEIQAQLDQAGSGLEMVAVVIEAIHPPAGAADAYHYVRAAEIRAQASIASERGNALVIKSQSQQFAVNQINAARGTAAETVGAAQMTLARFSADQQAARAGGKVFLLERYLADVSQPLSHLPLTIIDHRLNWPEAPVLDLRPLAGGRPTGEKGE